MAQGEYNVVFRGALTGEKSADEVKAELGTLFNAPPERIEALFSGKPVVVKRSVDASTATKFRAAFQRAGALCELVKADEPEPAPEPPSQPRGQDPEEAASREQVEEVAAAPPPPTDDSAPEARPSAASAEDKADSMAVSGDPNRTIVDKTVPSDLSYLSIDDSDRPHQPHEEAPPPQVDISGLSLAEDAALPSRQNQQPEREFDTSGMSLEPPPERHSTEQD